MRIKHILAIWLCFAAFLCRGGIFDNLASGKFKNVDAAADRYEFIGRNIIASGHVVVILNDMRLTADKAVFNPDLEDMELAGHVTFVMGETEKKTVTLEEYEALMQDPNTRLKLLKYVTSPSGRKMLDVEIANEKFRMEADRVAGNLKTGLLQFRNFTLHSGILFCKGEQAERLYNGKVTIRNAKVTTCDYLMDDHDHYAIFTKEATISPRAASRGVFNYNPDHGEHSIWAWNNFIEIYGVPVFWLPVLHKPKDLSSFGGRIEFGNTDRWGFYVRTSKSFQLMDEPYLNANLMLDFYQRRGFGYGVGLDLLTPEASTEMMFYGLRDWEPYYYWRDKSGENYKWAENNSRLKIPHYRYEFRIANLTHLLPNLDFRAQIDKLSDYNFLDEYFNSRYNSVLEPPTFASLEYQTERMTATLWTNIRINDFFTTVQRIPELRLDFQRQELFANIYYQGETSASYLSMKWRDFDRPRKIPELGELDNYDTFRFDTLHMFYYPLKFFDINIIPRAGFRLTAYSRSSDKKISYKDLSDMYIVDRVDGQTLVPAVNYDSDGGSRLRFTGEIGVEANTKFYHAWQEVKNAYWDLDGLRHIMQPYVNYTFIPKPNVSCDNLYYFDEIDRITEQNFVRLGLVNRLQTRRDNKVEQILSLEHFWDYYFHRESGFNSIGDLGTMLSLTPGHGLSLTSLLLVDMGGNNDHDYDVTRGRAHVGRPGISAKFINRWYTTLSWNFAPQWTIKASYNYSDQYDQRSPYSMGTMFASVNATSMFLSRFTRSQQCSAALEFPIYFDPKMTGSISCTYDVDKALVNDINLTLKRRFHCIDLAVAVGRTQDRDNTKGRTDSFYFSFFVSLSALPMVGTGYSRK